MILEAIAIGAAKFLAKTVWGALSGGAKKWGTDKLKQLFYEKILGKKLPKSDSEILKEVQDYLRYHVDDFQNCFEVEFNDRLDEFKDKQDELLEAINALGIIPKQVDIEAVIKKALSRSPFELFIDLDTFLERVDPELGETEHYVPRADELEILDKFLDSDARLLLVYGDRGVGKTRLLIEYARKLAEKGKAYRFCSKLGSPSDREYATAIEECSDGEDVVIFSDEIESLHNKKSLLDFLLDTNRLNIGGDLKIIGCTVYPEKVARDDLCQWTEGYELGKFDKPEGLEEIARRNFPKDVEKVNLKRMVLLCQGYPDAVKYIFELLKEGEISFDELHDRNRILNLRFEKMYNELGEYKAALAILAAIRIVKEDDLRFFNDFYAGYGDGIFARALNDNKLKRYIAVGEDPNGELVRFFISRELFANYLVQKFFFETDAKGNLARLASVVAKTLYVALFTTTVLSFHNNEGFEKECDLAMKAFLKTTQEEAPLEALMAEIVYLPRFYSRKEVVYGSINWKNLRKRLPEFKDPHEGVHAAFEIGKALYELKGLNEAREWFNLSLSIAKESGCIKLIMGNTEMLSAFLSNQGYHNEAFEIFERIRDIYVKLGVKQEAARYFHKLGILAEEKSDYEGAWKLQSKAKELFKELNDDKNYGVMVDRMEKLALRQGKYDLAKELCEESFKISLKLDDQLGIAISLHQRGILAKLEGDYSRARRYFKKSIDIKDKLNFRTAIGVALSLLGLGGVEEKEENYYGAFKYYYNALQMYLNLDKSRVSYAYDHFSGLLEKIGPDEFQKTATQVGKELNQDLSYVLGWLKEGEAEPGDEQP